MSELKMLELHRPLADLVTQVDAKITSKKDQSMPYVGLEHIPSKGAYLLGWGKADSSISTNSIFSKDDVLFGKLRPNLRKCIAAPFNGYCSTDILVLRANVGIVPGFAVRVFQTEAVGAAAEKTSIGTKMPRTSWGHLGSEVVFCPDCTEQAKIAQVLDTLDTAIRQTEAIVDKLKQVNQGLLHDLLTRGVNTNGELRPSYEQAPELYQDSRLGWIPKKWNVAALGELSESLIDGPFGSNLKTAHYVENPGVRVVRLQNILAGQYDDSEPAFISERHAASLIRNRVSAGDALIASLGDTSYPVGRSCCYPAELPDAINKADCFRFRSGPRCRNKFVMHSMNSAAARRQVRGYEQGVTMKRINLGNLRLIEIALPSIPEQDAIVARLESAQLQIDTGLIQLQKLRSEKLGLMDDLLTGRVRVTQLLAQ